MTEETIGLTEYQIRSLSSTETKSFYLDQSGRFEDLKHPGATAVTDIDHARADMVWFERYIEALFAFNLYSKRGDCALLYDLASDNDAAEFRQDAYCLVVSNGGWILKQQTKVK